MKGRIIPRKKNLNNTIKEILRSLLGKGCFDAILVPARVPSGESFVYLLIKNIELLESCTPLPPIMPIQGARALQNFTRRGKTNLKVLCVMRPCEIRASIELSKLKQIKLENISFISIDCPGALPTKDYINEPEKFDKLYQEILKTWESDNLRSACKTCLYFSYENSAADLHIGLMGTKEDEIILTPLNAKTKELFGKIDIECSDDLSEWQTKVKEFSQKRIDHRNKIVLELRDKVSGSDNLSNFFSNCINCHNCMRVCPICYCRQCFFDSGEEVKLEAEDYLAKAKAKSGIKFPGNMILFHLGRMFHMALSCVGCGSCEDGCPMEVPVSQVFGFIADETQKMFDYVPGRDKEESVPILTYKEDELHEYEEKKNLR